MITEKHVMWLERNDGSYEIIPDSCNFERGGVFHKNKVRVVFRSTMFSFNEGGISQAIDSILDMYPDSLK